MNRLNSSNLFSRIYLFSIVVFLYLPILVMILMSFNTSKFYQLPIDWTFDWYVELAGNKKLLKAGWNSLFVAIVSTIISSVLGTCVAYAFFRFDFKGKRFLQILLLPPITIPWLIIGTSMLIFFFWVGIGRGLFPMILGHVALSIPYVVIVVGARMKTFDIALEESARSLGASPLQAFFKVTLPWIFPGFFAASLFAFAVSLDQFVISYFLATPGERTLPVEIYTAIRKGFTPEINAISTIIILLSMSILLVVSRFHRFSR